MNRSRYIDRIHLTRSADSDHGRIASVAQEGTERALGLGTVLASMCSEELLESLIHHVGALQEWGGQMFVSAAREKFDQSGNRVEHREAGEYLTVGYVVNYNHRSTIKGQVQEPDSPLTASEAPEPEPIEEESPNGVPDPEPVEA